MGGIEQRGRRRRTKPARRKREELRRIAKASKIKHIRRKTELADVFAIQLEIAGKIATALKVPLRTAGEVPRDAASATSAQA